MVVNVCNFSTGGRELKASASNTVSVRSEIYKQTQKKFFKSLVKEL